MTQVPLSITFIVRIFHLFSGSSQQQADSEEGSREDPEEESRESDSGLDGPVGDQEEESREEAANTEEVSGGDPIGSREEARRRRKREEISGEDSSRPVGSLSGDSSRLSGSPSRIEGTGARAGLKSGVRITLDLHSNFISHGSVHHDYNAFKVFVGQRTEFPLLSQYGVGIQPGYEHFLSVSSSVVSSNDIRGLSPQARNCYFSDEGSLLYYKSYTFSNCMFECSIKTAQALLKCSLWFLPHPSGMVICDPWSGFRFTAILESGGGKCGHCLPDCESVTLDITQNRPQSIEPDYL